MDTLEGIITEKLKEDVFLFSPIEFNLFYEPRKKIRESIDLEKIRKEMTEYRNNPDLRAFMKVLDYRLTPENLEETERYIEKSMGPQEDIVITPDNIEDYRFLFTKGYAFVLQKDFQVIVKVPEDLKEIVKAINQRNEDKIRTYQLLQELILSLSNLYGVCPYPQLYKVLKQYTDSKLYLKKIRDYLYKLNEKTHLYHPEEHYYANGLLSEEDLNNNLDCSKNITGKSLLKIHETHPETDYYIPEAEEILSYAKDFFGPQAIAPYEKLKAHLIAKTALKNPQESDVDDLDDNRILDQVKRCAKMGCSFNDLIKNIETANWILTNQKDTKKAETLYQKLLEKTRKWPMKGALSTE